MLVELHLIQNHSPANLNRDDLGAPKTCIFGGVTRARISSQCLKRSIRRSEQFRPALEKDRGVRTRSLIREIASRAAADGDQSQKNDEKYKEYKRKVKDVFTTGGLKPTEIEGDPDATEILWFVPDSAIAEMAKAVREHRNGEDLGQKIAAVLGQKASVPDIALSGRMTEFNAQEHFRNLASFRVEAALAAAHAISTHEVTTEVDYFTAVDDLASGRGAGHVNEAMFVSACFYKYFCIDWTQLVENLADNTDLAAGTVKHFIYAAALSTPSGKQKSYAGYNPPDGILVEIKKERRVPTSYANAFAEPVPLNPPGGLVGESIRRLVQYVHEIAEGYNIPAERFWFSPGGARNLSWTNRNAGGSDAEKPVIADQRCFGSLDDLVENVMEHVNACRQRRQQEQKAQGGQS